MGNTSITFGQWQRHAFRAQPVRFVAPYKGTAAVVAARPRVNDWYARMTSRPDYASAMPPADSEGGQPARA